MGLFYAYVIDVALNPLLLSLNRWVVTFQSRAIADEWWRKIDDNPTAQKSKITRISPQLYKNDASTGYQAYDSITEKEDKMFFTALPGRGSYGLTLIPPATITDHISGGTYFIRSQSSPDIYWCVKDDKFIHASRTERTKFRIRIKGASTEGKVMIGSDDIQITLAFGDLKTNTNDSNVLVAGKKAETYKFSDFSGGFMIQGAKGPDECGRESSEVDKIYKTDQGEIWELTN
ncbi:hypothetical protein ONZ43_g5994 [Nemania bipapillata]|uniref:Uncharacterized protein n=1 Tax=Nemania bipapillata TaxID=110536 RepID=A0ACC2I3Y1_9PEZI|nr:hypothetical protein ONZ43_g5994 [Nemania bipapillata]